MLPLASISGLGILVLLIVGCLVFKVSRGGLHSAPGFILKTLGVVAVLGGLGVLVSRHDRDDHEDRHHALVQGEIDRGLSHLREEIGSELKDLEGELDEHLHDQFGRDLHFEHNATLHRGLLILLGSGLIILGAMLFGRDRTRPFALKALTFLGVGAIIFSVASFFGEPPRAEPTVRVVNAERHRVEHEEHRIAKRPNRPTRAKRPALRPDRPSSAQSADKSLDDFLPPRAGEIPVAAELAKAERQAAIEKLATEPKAAEEVQEEIKVAEPQVAEAPVVMPPVAEPEIDEPKIETPVVVADKPVEGSSPMQEAPAAEAPAEVAAKPAEEAKPVAAAEPAAAAKPNSEAPAVVATEVAAKEVVAESKPTDNKVAEDKLVETAAKPAELQPAAEAPAAPAIVPSQPRPAWVDRAPGLNDGIYALVVSSGPYSSVPECQRALNDEILSATNHYINEYLGDDNAASLVNLPVSFSRQVIKKQEYAESLESPSVGRMYQLHAQLAFDDQARNLFQQRWRNAIVQDRLWYTGGGAALVLALLATFYGYLKLDLKTDAPHKGRLQLAATLVALLVAAGALLARWAVPF